MQSVYLRRKKNGETWKRERRGAFSMCGERKRKLAVTYRRCLFVPRKVSRDTLQPGAFIKIYYIAKENERCRHVHKARCSSFCTFRMLNRGRIREVRSYASADAPAPKLSCEREMETPGRSYILPYISESTH